MNQTSGQFGRYLVVGVLSVAVDSAVLVLLRDGLHLALWVATTGAFVIAFATNFGLNFRWVFGSQSRVGTRLVRYGSLVAVNYAVTLVLVLGLSAGGLHYLLAKWTAVALCVVLNFVAYREWVFA